MNRWLLAGLLLLLAAPAAWAQTDPPGPEAAEEQEMTENERLLRAILLPRTSQEARRAGVPEEELRQVLRQGRERRVPPADMDVVLDEEVKAVREHGPIDNFGAFVQARLAEGLRGRELAAAIRAEHAARGKGKGHMKKMEKEGRAGMAKAKTGQEGAGPGASPQDEADSPDARQGKAGRTKAKRKGDGS